MKQNIYFSNSNRLGLYIISVFSILVIIGMFFISPIKQDLMYHEFVDSNTFLGISNFCNVISNLPFLIVGLFGLINMRFFNKPRFQYNTLFIGIILIAFGSGYYHLNPNNDTLIWDRLPMTIMFMSLVSIIISEFINSGIGKKLLVPLLTIGFLSILFWVHFDDLRIYIIVQFLPLITLPLILIFFKSNHNMKFGYWMLMIAYVLAKGFEYFDSQIFDGLKIVSGHSLKHLFSAIGLFGLIYCYLKREINIVDDKKVIL